MTIDVQSLRGALRELKSDVAALNRRVEAVEQLLADADSDVSPSATTALQLPPEIVVAHPDIVADYLQARPILRGIVEDLGQALHDEFVGESARVLLHLEQDEHVDDYFLVFNVRLPEYPADTDLVVRLDRVTDAFDARLSHADGWVMTTTDFRPAEQN